MTLENVHVLLRWGFFASLMLTTGVVSYVLLLAKGAFSRYLAQRLRYPLRATVLITLFLAVGILLVQHVMMSEAWRQLLDLGSWRAVLGTTSGRGWGIQVSLALLTGVMLPWRTLTGWRVLGIIVLLQWCALSLMGHAAAQEGVPGLLQRGNHVLHMLAAALWVGGLPPLLWVMAESRRPQWRSDTIATLLRFSRYGHLWVAVTVISGLLNSLLILDWPPSRGLYSALLLAKAVLVCLMIALAVVNRYWLVPRLGSAQGDAARRRLITHVWLAIALSALVLMLVSVFATLSPYSA